MILIIHSQNTITHSLIVEADILFCFSDYESDYSHIYGRLPLPYGRFRQVNKKFYGKKTQIPKIKFRIYNKYFHLFPPVPISFTSFEQTNVCQWMGIKLDSGHSVITVSGYFVIKQSAYQRVEQSETRLV